MGRKGWGETLRESSSLALEKGGKKRADHAQAQIARTERGVSEILGAVLKGKVEHTSQKRFLALSPKATKLG